MSELEHIKKLYDRIDGIKDQLIEINKEQGEIKEKILENKIDDLMSNEELQKEIRSMASKQGRNTVMKWGGGLVALIEVIRQVLGAI